MLFFSDIQNKGERNQDAVSEILLFIIIVEPRYFSICSNALTEFSHSEAVNPKLQQTTSLQKMSIKEVLKAQNKTLNHV